ncbi:hypothetical protein SD71_16110 [Cohnella kolymensis]|uniref:Uncharacterized protein n=1 Tax=Cohnella kolymensis TaxID=1590652 RepID=A0ABR5A2D2_9BACL|nr:hypothetical protein [Cohnella kolymensis]KIL35150.1 hypothetical protein SD71_16110 [Cohnella kolymensis]
MFKSGYVLDTPEKIAAAIHNQTPVDVWHLGEIVDYGGKLLSQSDAAVKFQDGSYYLKENHEFRIR